MSVKVAKRLPYDIGIWVRQGRGLPYALTVASAVSLPSAHVARSQMALPIHFRVPVPCAIPYSIQDRVKAQAALPYDLTTRVRSPQATPYDVLMVDRGRSQARLPYAILQTSIQTITAVPFVTHQGRRVELVAASVALDENSPFWNARLAVARIEDYYRLSRKDALTLDVHGEEYELVVESKSISRPKPGSRQFEINCMSPHWLKLSVDAEPITKTWGAVKARDVVEELVGEAVDWDIIDWTIPAKRLSAVDTTPIQIVQSIAAAAGAVVESRPEGTLRVRYLYPVSIPQVPGATPNHTLTETQDIIALQETAQAKRVVTKLTLSDSSEDDGYLAAEEHPDNPDVALAGESKRIVVFHDDKVQIDSVVSSTGTVHDQGTQLVKFEETLSFSDTDRASVQRPIHSDFSITWYGNSLGAVTTTPGGRDVVAAAPGVAVARVTYKAQARVYRIKSPTTSGGKTQFPVLVYIVGSIKEVA